MVRGGEGWRGVVRGGQGCSAVVRCSGVVRGGDW